MGRPRLVTAAGVATALLCAPHAFAHTTRTTVAAIHGTFDDKGFITGFQGFSPAPPAVPAEAVFKGSSTVIADHMEGSVVYTLWGKPNTGGWFDFHTVETFTGWVAGCGHGRMTYDVVGRTTPNGPPDTNQTLDATWTIVPGSGAGGLTRVRSGGGKLHGTVQPTTANNGDILGLITCSGGPREVTHQ